MRRYKWMLSLGIWKMLRDVVIGAGFGAISSCKPKGRKSEAVKIAHRIR